MDNNYKLLFKYVSDPLRILEEGYIRATQLSALNDPFEAVYCASGLRELASHFDDVSPEEALQHIEKNKNKVGVICFTEAKDNLLMWSHYANEHKGALIGISMSGPGSDIFEKLIPFDNNSTNSMGDQRYAVFDGTCRPVQYRRQPRYRVDQFDFDYGDISAQREDRLLYEIFQRKSDEWIYEKEHRITLRLEQADLAIVNDLDAIGNTHFVRNLRETGICSDVNVGGRKRTRIAFDQLSEQDDFRQIWSGPVAELSRDPSNLYFFKLHSSALSNLVLGHRADRSILQKIPSYPRRTGFFDIYTAKLDYDHYTLRLGQEGQTQQNAEPVNCTLAPLL